ncbi:hypothetical protein BDW42DRAFT_185331 [Aspergillus taichungensis]|uniref:RRM domain-containing protein n=1 Tax=Aspergillus taichungensis TaxID=482145 RepID=A0A2J5HW23_9EURO|nr:hypothetical protein BDW42DRAFT_185331 [Aspergillus taichungensis]
MSGSSNQSARTSPGSFNTNQHTPSVSSGASPPHPSFPSSQPPSTAQNAMSTDVYHSAVSHPTSSLTPSFSDPFSPLAASAAALDAVTPTTMRHPDSDRSSRRLNGFARSPVSGTNAIIMRKLPQNTGHDALRSMLLFSKGLVDVEFIPYDPAEDAGYKSAIARFASPDAAEEAQLLLHGKRNSTDNANMIVELYNGPGPRRNTIDHSATSRGFLGSGIPTNGPSLAANGPASAASDSFPPSTAAGAPADAGHRIHTLFSPQSPIGNGIGHDLPRVSGKAMIDGEPEDDTTVILDNPLAYAEKGHAGSLSYRRSTNPPMPTGQFANLSLATNISSPPVPNYPSGGSAAHMGLTTPSPAFAPSMTPTTAMGAGHGVPYGKPHGNPPRNSHPSRHSHSLPAANPNDQNPPCNTLYVGNLPPDTSEEELKALFSKQRGYKRLCFRNKQNGPMCFVEFEDVGTAGKSLTELYGFRLSNSMKTGIRLSFSKNPLGVRSGQSSQQAAAAAAAAATAMASSGVGSGGAGAGGANLAGLSGHGFAGVTRPPPGLESQAPPGLPQPIGMRGNGTLHGPGSHGPIPNPAAAYNPNAGLGIRSPLHPMMTPTPPPSAGAANGTNGTTGPSPGQFNSPYPDYMLGR